MDAHQSNQCRSPRVLIAIANSRGRSALAGDGPPGVGDPELQQLQALLAAHQASLAPILGKASAARALATGAPAAFTGPASTRFFRVDAPDSELELLRETLANSPLTEAAYIKPASESPTLAAPEARLINRMIASGAPPAGGTPSFMARQIYLDGAPAGINAAFAWAKPGGAGGGVKITDLEWAWESGHEDLVGKLGLTGGTQSGDTNHGTAVVGVLGANQNAFGVTGIAHDATLAWRAFPAASSQAIEDAADASSPGDILLLEIHRAGPRFGFAARRDQAGYIAIEWWPDDFEAIAYAVSRGVIVVEAGGNGAEDLDDAIYDTPGVGFGSSWVNPFRRNPADCGAILVGAGAPPPGTHAQNWGPDRSRLDFSNHGSAFDAQGWGREVTSCGYGDLQGGVPTHWYTDTFSGTSSASPIIAGTLACVQGNLRARGKALLTPSEARQMLRATGSPQQASPAAPLTQRIGRRPDLKQMLAWADAARP